MDHPFRNAAFGGFNRQDVLDYLEKTVGESSRRQQELELQCSQLQEERNQLSATVSQQEAQIHALTQEREQLRQELEQVKAALESGHDQEVAQEEAMTALQQERDALLEQVRQLEPDAAAFSAIKDRSAGVELEAHCRAQAVINQAQSQAQEIKSQLAQWLGRIEQEYDILCTQVASTVAHASDELEKAGQALHQVNHMLAQQDIALDELTNCYLEGNPSEKAE